MIVLDTVQSSPVVVFVQLIFDQNSYRVHQLLSDADTALDNFRYCQTLSKSDAAGAGGKCRGAG